MTLLCSCGDNSATESEDINKTSTVQDYEVSLTTTFLGEEIELEGKYSGKIVNGKPEGQGTFTAYTDAEAVYIYEGEFADGCFNGYGITTIESDEEAFEMAGTYTSGAFTPTEGEYFNFIGQVDYFGKFDISEDVVSYIDKHDELYPHAKKDAVKNADIKEFSNKRFLKTRKQDEIGLVKINLYAVQAFEDELGEDTLTSILCMDNDNNFYALYYFGSVEVYDGDNFTAYAVPCATSSFSNVSGGSTNVTVLAACRIE